MDRFKHEPTRITYLALCLALALLAACAQPAATPQPTETAAPPTHTIPPPTNTLPPPTHTLPPTNTPTPAPPTPTHTPPPPTDVPTWPGARIWPGLVYDANSQRVILIGGVNRSCSGVDCHATDMWALDTVAKRWTLLEGQVPTRYMNGGEGYDAESDRIVVQDWYSSYTHVLDADLARWERKAFAKLGIRHGGAMAYDAESDRLILFGGWLADNSGCSDATWAYDTNTDTWTQMKPEAAPPPRVAGVMVYDESSDRMYLWGGWCTAMFAQADPAIQDRQVWAYDYNHDVWTALGDSDGPEVALCYAAAAHHPATGRMIVFGGQFAEPDGLSDQTWAYSYQENAWTELQPDQSPSPRMLHGMAYDAAADKIVLFGGAIKGFASSGLLHADNMRNELWLFDPKTDQWSQVTPSP